MGDVVRPRFGLECFGCGAITPTQRVRRLRAAAAAEGRELPASEIVCVDCRRWLNQLERAAEAARRPASP